MKLLKVLVVMFFVGFIFGNQAQAQGTRAVQTQWNNQPQHLVRPAPLPIRPPQGNWNNGGNWNHGNGNWNNGNHWNNGNRWNNNWNVNIGVGPGWNGGCWNCWNTWGPGPIIFQQSAPVIIFAPPVIVQPTVQQRLAQVDQWLLNGQITFNQAAQMRINIFNSQYSNFNQ